MLYIYAMRYPNTCLISGYLDFISTGTGCPYEHFSFQKWVANANTMLYPGYCFVPHVLYRKTFAKDSIYSLRVLFNILEDKFSFRLSAIEQFSCSSRKVGREGQKYQKYFPIFLTILLTKV